MQDIWRSTPRTTTYCEDIVWLEKIKEVSDLGIDRLVVAGGGEPTEFDHFAGLCEWIGASSFPAKLFTNGFGARAPLLQEYASVFESVSLNLAAIAHHRKGEAVRRLVSAIRTRGHTCRLNGILVISTRDEVFARVRSTEVLLPLLDSIILSPQWGAVFPSDAAQLLRAHLSDLDSIPIRAMDTDLEPVRGELSGVYCGSRFLNFTIGRDLCVYPCCDYAYRREWMMFRIDERLRVKEQWLSYLRRCSSPMLSVPCRSCFLAPINRVLAGQ